MRRTNKKATLGNSRKKVDPLRINTARISFWVSAVLWLAYSVYIYYDMAVVNRNTGSADVVTLFSFVNAGLLLFSGIKLGSPGKWTYILALSVVAFNILLTLLNILDLYFLVFFILDLLILWAILPLRRKYF